MELTVTHVKPIRQKWAMGAVAQGNKDRNFHGLCPDAQQRRPPGVESGFIGRIFLSFFCAVFLEFSALSLPLHRGSL